MRPLVLLALLSLPLASGAQALLVNLTPGWPTFNWTTEGATASRSLAPGNRLVLKGSLSLPGTRAVALDAGAVYYLARLSGPDRLYRVGEHQVLLINAANQAIDVVVKGSREVRGLLANGSFALAEGESVDVQWSVGDRTWSAQVAPGRVYRFELGSPEALGVQPVLVAWDDSIR